MVAKALGSSHRTKVFADDMVWKKRIGGSYSASILHAAGRLYYFSREGNTTVIAPGPDGKVLATSKLDGEFMASPAISGKAFILRTKSHLYRIAE